MTPDDIRAMHEEGIGAAIAYGTRYDALNKRRLALAVRRPRIAVTPTRTVQPVVGKLAPMALLRERLARQRETISKLAPAPKAAPVIRRPMPTPVRRVTLPAVASEAPSPASETLAPGTEEVVMYRTLPVPAPSMIAAPAPGGIEPSVVRGIEPEMEEPKAEARAAPAMGGMMPVILIAAAAFLLMRR